MLGPTGVVATWNIGAERIKGYRADEIIGQHFSRFHPPEDIRSGKCEMELAAAERDGRLEASTSYARYARCPLNGAATCPPSR
jgi:PAS domain S-box-containing protein